MIAEDKPCVLFIANCDEKEEKCQHDIPNEEQLNFTFANAMYFDSPKDAATQIVL